ncbi:MAG: flagellar basal-body rod protein FlgG [Candidatus Omnitrophica bacterium]|nr:flagellar basal-body rod protein FlgG [Candidatus Omnitrophota bacterium]
MIRALFSGATGMIAQELYVDVTANNIANVNTNGFKKTRVDFEDLLYQINKVPGTEVASGVQNPTGIQVGLGVRPTATQKIYTQGDFKITGNALDLAIEGEGFFQMTMPSGELRYTRDGAFRIDSEGQVVNGDGFLLEPAITIPTDAVEVSVGVDGTVSVLQAGDTAATTVGQIELVRFPNQAGLLSEGRNLLSETAASGSPVTGTPGEDGIGEIASGTLESSNVELVEEMVNLIIAQRGFEANSNSIKTADEMLRLVNNM